MYVYKLYHIILLHFSACLITTLKFAIDAQHIFSQKIEFLLYGKTHKIEICLCFLVHLDCTQVLSVIWNKPKFMYSIMTYAELPVFVFRIRSQYQNRIESLHIVMKFYNIVLIGFRWQGEMKSEFDKNEWCEILGWNRAHAWPNKISSRPKQMRKRISGHFIALISYRLVLQNRHCIS